ncbi:hypothetical protein QQF54_08695 [Lelliottia sp. V106_10]|uniref:phage tail terminator protein n=1 Tax=Lelliottia wanjuensis TaxID=3050585 RepID=UPI00254B00E7|nr:MULTISPECIES: hypothetical protein [unclassified Lelliottia]MDK9373432.1 hypothetical protein [Lelliottia sp. V106_10]MDK9600225.1 hypothetical protein [Lelliottia sp. V106_5]
MDLRKIILALRERVPDFGTRVSGAAEFRPLAEVGKLALPAAYVIPLHDETEEQKSQTDYWQFCTDGFSVVVALDNRLGELGLESVDDAVHIVRRKLWRALLGWSPSEEYTRGIEYRGGVLLDMNRAILYYKFDFQATFEILPEDTWHQQELDDLPWLETVHIDVDLIDPGAGPDGHPEFQADIHLSHTEST